MVLSYYSFGNMELNFIKSFSYADPILCSSEQIPVICGFLCKILSISFKIFSCEMSQTKLFHFLTSP